MRAIFFAGALISVVSTWHASAITQAGLDAAKKRLEASQTRQQNISNPVVTTFGVPDQERARKAAELTYNTWRVSLLRGNEQGWRSSTCASRQMKVRNLIVSQRGVFPRDFFKQIQDTPQLENFLYVGALTGCNGATMACTYIGKLKLGDQAAEESAFVLEFVFENNKWKLDQTRFFNLSKLPEVKKRLMARDIKLLQEQDGFQPYNSIPATPPACKQPELIGKVFVDCPGRVIEMTVNGVSAHKFEDERRADVISGGLKRGVNTISYTIKDNDGQPRPSMAIGLFVAPETPGNSGICVFDHLLDEQDKAEGGTFSFNITREQIASMNPKFQGNKTEPFHAVPLKEKPQK